MAYARNRLGGGFGAQALGAVSPTIAQDSLASAGDFAIREFQRALNQMAPYVGHSQITVNGQLDAPTKVLAADATDRIYPAWRKEATDIWAWGAGIGLDAWKNLVDADLGIDPTLIGNEVISVFSSGPVGKVARGKARTWIVLAAVAGGGYYAWKKKWL